MSKRIGPLTHEQDPPCRGKHQLFDSTNLNDHTEARALCEPCPLFWPCRKAGIKYDGSGTWGGALLVEGWARPMKT